MPGVTRQLKRGTNEIAISRGIGDVGVRRQHSHQRIAIFVRQMNGGESDGGRGVASDRFGQDVRRGNTAQLVAHCGGLFHVRYHPDIFLGNQRRETRGRFAQAWFPAP